MLIQWVGSPDLRIAHLFCVDVSHTAPKTIKESGHLALFEKPPFFLKALRAAFGAWHIVAASGGTKRVDAESTATLRLSVRCALQAFFICYAYTAVLRAHQLHQQKQEEQRRAAQERGRERRAGCCRVAFTEFW